jgi:glutaminase
MTDYQKVLDSIYEDVNKDKIRGDVANYIPALSKVSLEHFGMTLRTSDGKEYAVGESDQNFSIQSISKLFILTMVMMHTDSDRWDRVGREPSGNSFNSLVQLEQENGKPRNPFINAGAIVMTDYLHDFYKRPGESILEFVRKISQNNTIGVNRDVFESEKATGHRNYALGHFMKSYENINHDVIKVLETYFFHCSIEMSCDDLARSVDYLVHSGKNIIEKSKARRINALMLTCGPYDDAGEFAFRIGIPTKSGVGGGIVGVCPGEYSVAVWSPGLNKAGNSLLGTKALRMLTNRLDSSIF